MNRIALSTLLTLAIFTSAACGGPPPASPPPPPKTLYEEITVGYIAAAELQNALDNNASKTCHGGATSTTTVVTKATVDALNSNNLWVKMSVYLDVFDGDRLVQTWVLDPHVTGPGRGWGKLIKRKKPDHTVELNFSGCSYYGGGCEYSCTFSYVLP